MNNPYIPSLYDVNPDFDKLRDTFDLKDGTKTFPDMEEPAFWRVYEAWKPYTLLSTERVYNLYQVTRYIAANRLSGDFVECGVLLGGASIMMAIFAEHFGLRDRKHYMFDTFCGFTRPTLETDFAGESVRFGELPRFRSVVEKNIARCGIDASRFVLVEGAVQDTLPHLALNSVCLLRLDTDDYKSTLHELRSVYPMVVPSGILIVDDYGHYKGARRAVDEYFDSIDANPLLQRVDYSGRCAVKMPSHPRCANGEVKLL
jgi:O-methyltransferase